MHVCLCRLGMRQEWRSARRCRLVRLWWQRTVRRLGLRHGWRCGQRGSLRLWRRVELRVCPCRLVMRQERRCAQFRRASFRVLSGRLSLPQNQDTAHHVCFSETGVICGVKIPPVSPARIELQHGRRRWRCCRLSSLSGFRSSSPRRRRSLAGLRPRVYPPTPLVLLLGSQIRIWYVAGDGERSAGSR